MLYNVYCDESCHLEHDDSNIMVLGAMYCSKELKARIFTDIRNIKLRYGLSSHFEIKWTKVSQSKIDFYIALLDYYWNSVGLKYRCLVVINKDLLDHDAYNDGDYDLWYYKMYYYLINGMISSDNTYHIMVDIKDTHGGGRVEKLREVLCNGRHDFDQLKISAINQINSKESEILQLADLINGAIGFHHRGLDEIDGANKGKIEFVNKLMELQQIDKSTSGSRDSKFDLFIWQPR